MTHPETSTSASPDQECQRLEISCQLSLSHTHTEHSDLTWDPPDLWLSVGDGGRSRTWSKPELAEEGEQAGKQQQHPTK